MNTKTRHESFLTRTSSHCIGKRKFTLKNFIVELQRNFLFAEDETGMYALRNILIDMAAFSFYLSTSQLGEFQTKSLHKLASSFRHLIASYASYEKHSDDELCKRTRRIAFVWVRYGSRKHPCGLFARKHFSLAVLFAELECKVCCCENSIKQEPRQTKFTGLVNKISLLESCKISSQCQKSFFPSSCTFSDSFASPRRKNLSPHGFWPLRRQPGSVHTPVSSPAD